METVGDDAPDSGSAQPSTAPSPLPSAIASATDLTHLGVALELAALGPLPDPNPRVGCVLTDAAGVVVGRGHHAGAGSPHAEVVALRAAAEAGACVRGGTAYVTLEPCAHTGRTGPCADALIGAGVARVVVAQTDPNPLAAGGVARLRAAGVVVVTGVRAAEAEQLNAAWSTALRLQRPLVTWKLATSLDGRSAAADGTSRWITGPRARADVHDLRARCDAILVGTGTVLADDPSLTTRWPDGTLRERQPLRVVMGRRDLPAGAAVLDDAAPTLHLRTRDPREVLDALWRRDVRHLLLEGGPQVAAAFAGAGLVDEVVAYVAPVLFGAGALAVGPLGITTIGDALRLEPVDVSVLGADVRITARPTQPSDSADSPDEEHH